MATSGAHAGSAHPGLAAGERQPDLCRSLFVRERAQIGPVERRQRSPLLPLGEVVRPRRVRIAVAERILGAIGSRRHGGSLLEADPIAAGDSKRSRCCRARGSRRRRRDACRRILPIPPDAREAVAAPCVRDRDRARWPSRQAFRRRETAAPRHFRPGRRPSAAIGVAITGTPVAIASRILMRAPRRPPSAGRW